MNDDEPGPEAYRIRGMDFKKLRATSARIVRTIPLTEYFTREQLESGRFSVVVDGVPIKFPQQPDDPA